MSRQPVSTDTMNAIADRLGVTLQWGGNGQYVKISGTDAPYSKRKQLYNSMYRQLNPRRR